MILASASYRLGDHDAARQSATRATTDLEALGATRQAAGAWSELAELYAAIGDPSGAVVAYRRATSLLGVSGQHLTRRDDSPAAPRCSAS